MQKSFFDRATSLLRSGDPTSALQACKDGLKDFPHDGNLLCLAAQCQLILHRYEDARKSAEQAAKLFPNFFLAHEVLGDLFFIAGQYDMAIRKYELVRNLEPGRKEIEERLQKAREDRDKTSSKTALEKKKELRKQFALLMDKAAEHGQKGETSKAEDIYRGILAKDPDHVEAARLLAKIATEHKAYRDAEVFLQRVVKNAPDYARAWFELANVLREQEKFTEAVDAAEEVLRLMPNAAETHVLLGNALGQADRNEDSIESYRRALALAPGHPGALSGVGHRLKTIGKQDEAIAAYRECLAANPLFTESYWSLANLKTFRFTDEEVATMESLLAGDEIKDESRVHIHNALGLEYEGRKDYAKAFSHFHNCNRIRRQSESYDPVEVEVLHDDIIKAFDKDMFARHEGAGCPDPAPIFVVGLPRSGSTLIEQILASHSQVEGTHELADLSRVVNKKRRRTLRGRFPETVAKLSTDAWAALGEEYIERTRKFRTDRIYFIDKNPNNYTYTGLLKLILPNAKIINARRHPLDSCFGSYKQLFAMGQTFSYDLVELGEYYLNYQRMMDHWHEVLPGFVLDVNYEEVVDDLETQVRRILDFCNLPFEEACLRFHETERAVKTASSEQVRQPIYSSSVNLWRNYEQDLGELIEVLEPLLVRLPDEKRPATLRGR